jgi:iron-sulfur cluster repair protein YtfE (RIC family)
MKRHWALVPLSREHHGALILSRLLQKDAPIYKGMPSDPVGKAGYAFKFYQEELVEHFLKEEAVMALILGVDVELDLLIDSIYREHENLHALFNRKDLVMHLDQVGKALEFHIRKEERQFFPLIQQSCNEELMKAIATLFPA